MKPIINLHLVHLTTLYLGTFIDQLSDHNNLSTDACHYLTKPKLQSLQTLDLTTNSIDDEGCKLLARGGNWPDLRTFFICSFLVKSAQNKLTVTGLLYLSKG